MFGHILPSTWSCLVTLSSSSSFVEHLRRAADSRGSASPSRVWQQLLHLLPRILQRQQGHHGRVRALLTCHTHPLLTGSPARTLPSHLGVPPGYALVYSVYFIQIMHDRWYISASVKKVNFILLHFKDNYLDTLLKTCVIQDYDVVTCIYMCSTVNHFDTLHIGLCQFYFFKHCDPRRMSSHP